MTRATLDPPPIGELDAALRGCTRRLAAELVLATNAPPLWSDLEWRVAMAVAAMHGIAALLAARLRWQGPPRWQRFLAEQHRQGTLREQRVEQTLARINDMARLRGLPLLALKGSALLALRLHRVGERPMGDIDLLARASDLPAAAELLLAAGWTSEVETARHHVFVPVSPPPTLRLGEHVDNPLRIELHAQIAERLPLAEVDITHTLWSREALPGLNPYASTAALLRHLLLHAAGSMQNRSLRLVQLRDLALLAPRLSASDWDELLDDGSGGAAPWWAWPPLALARDCQGLVLPAAVQGRLEVACPPRLRRALRRLGLEGVSWTQISIEAFPGLEWARSPGEAAHYIFRRIVPPRSTLALRRHPAVTPASLAPQAWSSQSQWHRMARWLVSTPPRVGTLRVVLLALDYEAARGGDVA